MPRTSLCLGLIVLAIGVSVLASVPGVAAGPADPHCVRMEHRGACGWVRERTYGSCLLDDDGSLRGCQTYEGHYVAAWVWERGMMVYGAAEAGRTHSWKEPAAGSCEGRAEGEGVYANGYTDQMVAGEILGEGHKVVTESGATASVMRHRQTECEGREHETISIYAAIHRYASPMGGEWSSVHVEARHGAECGIATTGSGAFAGADHDVGKACPAPSV